MDVDEPDAASRPVLAILLGGGVSTRELMIPLEILAERLDPDVVTVGLKVGPIPGHDPPLRFHVDRPMEDTTAPELILVPGGFGMLEMASEPRVADWLRRWGSSARAVLATSTGSLPLAAAGLLDRRHAAGHWLTRSTLERHGAVTVDTGLAVAGNIVTAAGWLHVADAAHLAADVFLYGRHRVSPPPAQ